MPERCRPTTLTQEGAAAAATAMGAAKTNAAPIYSMGTRSVPIWHLEVSRTRFCRTSSHFLTDGWGRVTSACMQFVCRWTGRVPCESGGISSKPRLEGLAALSTPELDLTIIQISFASVVAALIVNSFTASSDASLWLRKTLGIMSVPELMLTWISPSCRGMVCGLTKGGAGKRLEFNKTMFHARSHAARPQASPQSGGGVPVRAPSTHTHTHTHTLTHTTTTVHLASGSTREGRGCSGRRS